jgi:hypothetical protein
MRHGKDLSRRKIECYIMKYNQSWRDEDKKTFWRIHEAISRKGFLMIEQLYEVAYWKTPRASRIVKNNPDYVVKSITALALKIRTRSIRFDCYARWMV